MTALADLLATGAETAEVDAEGRVLRLTNLGKVLWPRTGTTKRALLEYYAAIAPVVLDHVGGRPLTLRRFPDGVEAVNWFQTTCPHPPDWLRTFPVTKKNGHGLSRNYCLVDDLAGLLWAVNLGSIELHPLLAVAEAINRPSVAVFDLDPGPDASIVDCCDVALLVRAALAERGLHCTPKATGGAGLHVYVPLNGPVSYVRTKPFVRQIAGELARQQPERIVDEAQRARRGARVFIDWAQNDQNKSLVAPYSLRGMPWPTVAAPLTWEEVEAAVEQRSAAPILFDAAGVVDRVSRRGDIFADVLDVVQALPQGTGLE